jgi:hypothetical protein
LRRILFVAIPESVHTARWLSQLKEEGWEIFLFPSYEDGAVRIHKSISGVNICIPFYQLYTFFKKIGLEKVGKFFLFRLFRMNANLNKYYYQKRLAKTIKVVKPNLIHSLETQKAGYLVADVKEKYFAKSRFPTWWHTNWGSDIYLFGRISSHQPMIRKVMENCDFYSCECLRDINLARQFGFNGIALPVYPNTGGFDPSVIDKLRAESLPTSERKIIMLKGYQGWAGRALVGIRALERCTDILTGYTIVIYSNSGGEDVAIASVLLSQTTGVKVNILPESTSHLEILRYHSLARVSIGVSITDAISTSLLEAMAMGSFPIQSCTACALEWFVDGVSGLIVSPEDPEVIEKAIRKALSDDKLVNLGSVINYEKIITDANYEKLKEKTIKSYKQALQINHV